MTWCGQKNVYLPILWVQISNKQAPRIYECEPKYTKPGWKNKLTRLACICKNILTDEKWHVVFCTTCNNNVDLFCGIFFCPLSLFCCCSLQILFYFVEICLFVINARRKGISRENNTVAETTIGDTLKSNPFYLLM